MMKGIDCAVSLNEARAAAARSAGFAFVGRYLVPPSYAKALSWAEAQTLCRAGLRLLTVWETTGRRALEGADAGIRDGTRALACARTLHMPEDGIIYFAETDFDAGPEDYDVIEAYLRAARNQTGPYEIGVYGSYRVVEEMYRRLGPEAGGVVRGFWQCVAWSGGRRSARLTVYQSDWSGTKAAKAAAKQIGADVDLNECPDPVRAGLWNYEEDDMTGEQIVEKLSDEQAYRLLEKAQRYARELPLVLDERLAAEFQAAADAGATDGSRPRQLAERWQSALMAYRAGKRSEGERGAEAFACVRTSRGGCPCEGKGA